MKDDTIEKPQDKSWLVKLSQILLREPQDREQLVTLLRDAEQRNLLDAESLGMIEGVFQISEMQVRDIMIPRTQMVTINENDSAQTIIPSVIDSTHSRFPVIGDNRDEVIGILLAKDLLKFAFRTEESEFNIHEIIRPTIYIPESKRLDMLLSEFRQTKNHMAIVVDEYGGVSGCVTLEDILEQIVGEIEDEFDVDDDAYIKQHNNHYVIKALTPIEDFNEFFTTDFSDDEFDTIGGLVIHAFGHLPQRGEKTAIDKYVFEVINANKRRIKLLKMTIEEMVS